MIQAEQKEKTKDTARWAAAVTASTKGPEAEAEAVTEVQKAVQ